MIFSREEVLTRLRKRIDRGEPIIGGGAGTGISAKFEEAGGIDLIVIYNSGRYRMAGRGSLAGLMPYGDANAIVMEMAGEVLPVVKDTPVLAGVCASDPFRLIDRFLDQINAVGFSGVQNFPTVGLIDGTFRANLEETGMGYDKEVELIRLAREKDLLTTPYVFNTARSRGDGRRRRRRDRRPHGPHDQRHDRRPHGPHARRLRPRRASNRRRRPRRPQRRHHPLPRRPDRDARRRRVRPHAHQKRPRLLRRVVDGAAAGGNGDDGAGAATFGQFACQAINNLQS